jgi:phage gp46-like protein
MNEFNGDLLLQSTVDGGEITLLPDDTFLNDTGFETAIYLSLFGGDYEDNGTESTKDKTWWGNNLEVNNPNAKLISRFQNLSRSMPLTPGNLLKLKDAVRQDLQWFIDEGIIDLLIVNMTIPNKNRIATEIIGLKDKTKIFGTKYEKSWISKIN